MRRRRFPLALLASLAIACGGRPASTPPDAGEEPFLPAPPSDQLDVLFVIDNSNGPVSDVFGFSDAFAVLMDTLAAETSSLSIQIGVATTDLGAGTFTPPSCDVVGGDQGLLQNVANGPTCSSAHLVDPADRYLRLTVADGAVGDPNFVGDLAEAVQCYAAVGAGGCGFEHVLGSMRAALDGCATPAGCAQPANAGFLRPDAYLAVIILTDEDDCSAPADSTLFDPTQTSLASPLGPLTSYRCFEFGVLCGGLDVGRDAGVRADCVAGTKDPDPRHQLVPVADFARSLKALKPRSPRMVYAAVLAPPPAPVEIGLDANGYPDLRSSCHGRPVPEMPPEYSVHGEPAIRLRDFATRFDADRHRWYDLCATQWRDAFTEIGVDLATALRGD